ncbi:MAG: hypothetical protein EXR51_11080 [Dehalococcoidia bacterium]|nr:hypothetical protein [Dehalococcoidia bacterium]
MRSNPASVDGALAVAAVLFWRGIGAHRLPAIQHDLPARALVRMSAGFSVGWAVVAIALTVLSVLMLMTPSPGVPPPVLALASAAAWIGLGISLDGGVSPAGVAARLKSLRRWEWVLGGSCVAIGLLVRLWGLDSLPAGFWFDEATAALEARSIVFDPTFRPVYSDATMSASGYVYLVAVAEWALGQTVVAVRLVPALAGALTPMFAWIATRNLLGPFAGVAACGLTAFARWDINFSRIGMQSATTPLLLLFTLTLLLYAIETRRWALFAAFGVALGGLGWFYTANLAFPLVVALTIPLMGRARGLRLKELGRRTMFATLCALAVVTPLVAFAIGNFDAVSTHAKSLSLLQTVPLDQAPLAIAGNGIKHLAMFTFAGDENGRHNLPGAPMLDPVTGALFLLGGVAALRCWRDPRSVMFLGWTLIMVLPGVLTAPYEAPQSLRSIGALPGAVVLAALGGWWLWRVLANGKITTRSLAALVTALAVAAFLNLALYFGPQARNDAVWRSFSMAQTIVAKELAQAGAASLNLASDHFVYQPVIRFLSGVAPNELKPSDLPVAGDGLPVTIYLDPLDRGYYELIKSYYPNSDCHDYRSTPDAAPVLHRCTVSPAEQASVAGLRVRYFDDEAALAAPVFEAGAASGVIPPLPPNRTGSHRVLMEGSLLAPKSGMYRFALHGPPQAQLYLDEGLELAAGNTSVSRRLAAGLHRVVVLSQVAGGSAPGRLLWQPPGEALGDIPAPFLFHGTVEAQGLQGSYYAGTNFGEALRFERIDPTPHLYFQTLPLDLPFRVDWTGSLLVQAPGPHRFSLDAINHADVAIDGKPVIATEGIPEPEANATVVLERGWHPIRVRLAADTPYAHIYLRWQPPGAGSPDLIPPTLMRHW